MMRERKDAVIDTHLADIVHSSERIEIYTQNLDEQSFDRSRIVQDAVIRCLEVIGEASGRILKIGAEFQTRFSALELKQAYRARNRTAQGYGSVGVASMWRTATFDVSHLAREARRGVEARR